MTDPNAAAEAIATDTTGATVANGNSKEKEGTGLDKDSLLEWEDVVKGLGVIGLVAYIGGLVIVNAYLSRFGASDFDVVRPHSIATTILALAAVVVPFSLLLRAMRWANAHTRNSGPPANQQQQPPANQGRRHRVELFVTVAGIFLSLVGILSLALLPFIIGVVAIIGAAIYNWHSGKLSGATVTRRSCAKAKKAWDDASLLSVGVYGVGIAFIYTVFALARHYALSALGVDASIGQSLEGALYLGTTMLALAFFALFLFDDIKEGHLSRAVLMGRANQWDQAKKGWGSIIIVAVVTFAYCTTFGLYLYPAIPQTWGGGMPEEARLIFTSAGAAEARAAHIPLCPAIDTVPIAFGGAMPVTSNRVKILYEMTDSYLLDITSTMTDTHSIVSFDKAAVAGVIHPAHNLATGAEDTKPVEDCL